MKKNLLKILLIVVIIIVPNAKAQLYSFNQNVPAFGKVSNAQQFGAYYKYVKVIVNANSSSASYSLSFIGTSSISKVNSVSPLATSAKNFTGTNTYTIYILPRSGMSCPSDASYCFGAGSDYSSSTVIQGNECDGKMCSLYGVRINNKKVFTSYDINVRYEFFY